MQIFICDDEPQMLADIVEKVVECLPDSDVRAFSSGWELLGCLEAEPCDILLLDIDLPDITGLEIAGSLAPREKRPLLLFVTSHDELVYDSFQYHPFAFLRKSCLDKEIRTALTDCIQELEYREKHFYFRAEGKRVCIVQSDILYFEADGNYLKLFAKTGQYRFRSTITAVENALTACGFIRIHKGFLVNQAAVRLLGAEQAQLSDGTVLPIGQNYAKTAKEQLLRYMRT
ncbi:MAG: LytTR family DNA-binding domain-containing protein [Muribaculum sp.]|nr:LytTR family DNA-binding domain-containing protein [Ruminococcus flavefaciens]MCM1373624.1 LytTR family DNA-binding domain-containing protein [Muribaculum sp.]